MILLSGGSQIQIQDDCFIFSTTYSFSQQNEKKRKIVRQEFDRICHITRVSLLLTARGRQPKFKSTTVLKKENNIFDSKNYKI